MAQQRMVANSQFQQGLIMDFAPDNQTDNSLSNALNATFVTFNGNEGLLQNDMGNCRVESAYLPEGYIPVGTCEFGDIIYVVSYNPLKDKSQIGCFPSPERNLSSSEISNLKVSIAADEFVGIYAGTTEVSGEVLSSQVKHIIYQNALHAGDKFIISWGEEGTRNNDTVSNVGNTFESLKETEQYWPKLLKVHVVSIEDDGKMTYLDDSVKWYGNDTNDFVISTMALTTNDRTEKGNIDDYRHALQSNYSVFQSRIPGKLALLLELEKITGFSCGHRAFIREEGDDTYYDIYLSASWDTNNYNINPCGLIITEADSKRVEIEDSKLDPEANLNINKYDCSRVIDISRTYKQEFPGDNYAQFIESGSYYNNKDIEKCLTDDSGQLTTNVIRVYEGTEPSEEDNLHQGQYYLNPTTIASQTQDITKMRIYENVFDGSQGVWIDSTEEYDELEGVRALLEDMFEGSEQSDNKITFHFETLVPKLDRWPVSKWNKDLYAEHDGDIYCQLDTSRANIKYIWKWSSNAFANLYKCPGKGYFDVTTWSSVSLTENLTAFLNTLKENTTIKIWFGGDNPKPVNDPTPEYNYPAEDWQGDELAHEGEYFWNINTGEIWRWIYIESTQIFCWVKASVTQDAAIRTLGVAKYTQTSEEILIYTATPGYIDLEKFKSKERIYYYQVNADWYWEQLTDCDAYKNLASRMDWIIEGETDIFCKSAIGSTVGSILLKIPSKIIYKNSSGVECQPHTIPDDVIVNTFKKSVLKEVGSLKTLTSKESEDCYYQYTVCPCMPYGVLEEFAITNTIRFNKKQTGEVDLNSWQYYAETSAMRLTFGFDTYLKECLDEVIDKVVFQFYDDQGLCASYELTDRTSYEAKFTEYFSLNVLPNNAKFTGYTFEEDPTIDDDGNELYSSRELTKNIFHHNSEDVAMTFKDIVGDDYSKYYYNSSDDEYNPIYKVVTAATPQYKKVFLNDSGIFYYGRPYLVKILIFKGIQTEIGAIDTQGYETPITYYRWMWTGAVLNDYYGKVADFNDTQIPITLDYTMAFNAQSLQEEHFNYYKIFKDYDYAGKEEGVVNGKPNVRQSLGAEITAVNFKKDNGSEQDIKVTMLHKAADYFNMTLAVFQEKEVFESLNVGLGLNNLRITVPDSISTVYEQGDFSAVVSELEPKIHPSVELGSNEKEKTTVTKLTKEKYSTTLNKLLGFTNTTTENRDIYDGDTEKSKESYVDNYQDWFDLEIIDGINQKGSDAIKTETVGYYDADGNAQQGPIVMHWFTAQDLYKPEWNGKLSLRLRGIRFNKIRAYTFAQKQISQILAPIVETPQDLGQYGINLTPYDSTSDKYGVDGGFPYFSASLHIGVGERKGKDGWLSTIALSYTPITMDEAKSSPKTASPVGSNYWEKQEGDSAVFKLTSSEGMKYLMNNVTTGPFVACSFGWADVGGTGGNAMERMELYDTFNPSKELTKYFGILPLKDAQITGQLPRSKSKSVQVWENGTLPQNQPVILGICSNNEIHLLGDWFLSKATGMSINGDGTWKESYSYFDNRSWMDYQCFYYNNYGSTSDPKYKYQEWGSVLTFAQLISSMFCQLFVVKQENEVLFVPENTIKLEDNDEQWRADIVVKITSTWNNYDDLGANSSSRMIALLWPRNDGYYTPKSLREFAQNILISAGLGSRTNDKDLDTFTLNEDVDKKVSIRNINPDVSPLVKVTEFNYTVSYHVDDITEIYSQDNTNVPYRYYDGNGEKVSGTSNVGASSTDIYLFKDGTFTKFTPRNANGEIKLVDRFAEVNDQKTIEDASLRKFYPIYGGNGKFPVKLNEYSNLDQVLYWDGYKIGAHDMDKLKNLSSTSRLYYYATGDNPSISDISKAHIFDYIHA